MPPAVTPLGRLVSVPLREVWAHEANDFTPWLAEADNVALLAETLGLGELQIRGTEVPVGNFYIDILARDIEGNVVIIENQFGPTDHTHLGQIITYIAGQEGKAIIVWIAETFREEHRAAIDWLNASTIEGFDFFAVEVEALKIGNSVPAPRFNVVAKPNEWSRDVTRTTRSGEGPLDERQKAYVAYWTALGSFLADHHAPFKVRVPTPRDYWCGFGNIGQSGFSLGATSGFRDRKLGVEIYIGHRAAKVAFDHLEAERATIEAEFGSPLDWQRLNDKKACRIAIYRTDLDPTNQGQWPQEHTWYLDQLERFVRVFRSRIDGLNIDALDEGSGPGAEPGSQ
jgi:hypothetical protein